MKDGKLSPKTIYGAFMVLFYLGISIALIFTSVFNDFFQNDILRIVIGVLFLAYGLFRSYRVWKDL